MNLNHNTFLNESIVVEYENYANGQVHSFHLVTESPWPIIGACAALLITVGGVWNLHWGSSSLLGCGFFMLFLVMFAWWSNVISEALYLGYHTSIVVSGLRIGMVLFIVSEIMFFVSFFWAFFHSSLSPSIVFGSVWPPLGICTINPLHLPLLNTFILVVSGVTVTLSHYLVLMLPYIYSGYLYFDIIMYPDFLVNMFEPPYKLRNILNEGQVRLWGWTEIEMLTILPDAELYLLVTIFLGLEFTCLQAFEYVEALFYINDGVYGSTFYVATGFHGLHVIIGSIFLLVAYYRLQNLHFSFNHHLGFELSIWYWHFVDVVWLVLYVFIYCWSGGLANMSIL